MVLRKGWINPQGEQFMLEARSWVLFDTSTVDQPERGGIDG
jgi:hypothetical protein